MRELILTKHLIYPRCPGGERGDRLDGVGGSSAVGEKNDCSRVEGVGIGGLLSPCHTRKALGVTQLCDASIRPREPGPTVLADSGVHTCHWK